MAPARPQKRQRGAGISARLFYGVFAVLLATNGITVGALYLSPQIAALVSSQQASVDAGYQDRIDELRLEVDRLHSRQYAQAGDINLQLQELAQQQEVLTEQHQYVKALIDKAGTLGLSPAPTAPIPADKPVAPDDSAPDGATDSDLSAADQIPVFGDTTAVASIDRSEIDRTGHQIRTMMDESREALDSLSNGADDATDEILAELRQLGIKPNLPGSGAAASDAMGGPLLPPSPDAPAAGTFEDTSTVDQANVVLLALARFKAARDAISTVPVLKPVASTTISSSFGNRVDPFTGHPALHPGIDFPNPTGTTVHAAGDGKVIYASPMSGYGNLVEIDHGNGYVSYYGHLSAYLVHVGDEVQAGDAIARVGSTGRSTGPHLHFEVRRDNHPIDPSPFLAIGRRLTQFMAQAQARADYSSPAAT
jgi:murein DD-endopeptidase MepM/ murein hydrolase activator NlpD